MSIIKMLTYVHFKKCIFLIKEMQCILCKFSQSSLEYTPPFNSEEIHGLPSLFQFKIFFAPKREIFEIPAEP